MFVTLNLIYIYFSYFKRSPLSGHLTLIPYQGLLSRNSGTMPKNITFNQNQEKVILCYQHPPRGQHTQVEEEQQQGETSWPESRHIIFPFDSLYSILYLNAAGSYWIGDCWCDYTFYALWVKEEQPPTSVYLTASIQIVWSHNIWNLSYDMLTFHQMSILFSYTFNHCIR